MMPIHPTRVDDITKTQASVYTEGPETDVTSQAEVQSRYALTVLWRTGSRVYVRCPITEPLRFHDETHQVD